MEIGESGSVGRSGEWEEHQPWAQVCPPREGAPAGQASEQGREAGAPPRSDPRVKPLWGKGRYGGDRFGAPLPWAGAGDQTLETMVLCPRALGTAAPRAVAAAPFRRRKPAAEGNSHGREHLHSRSPARDIGPHCSRRRWRR